MANTNLTPLPPETQELLTKFSTHLYARSGLKESSILLLNGYIRRMIPTMDYYLHPNNRNVKSDYHRYAPSFV